MAKPKKALFTWSGGKDSALALYYVQHEKNYDISVMLTTITTDYNRVSMHGFRTELLESQVETLGYKLEKIMVTKNSSNEEYENMMKKCLMKYFNMGIRNVIFGDIFLEDVRKYREKNLLKIGMTGVFPLWRKDTAELASEFIKLGFKAVVTCVDSSLLDDRFVGRNFDEKFLSDLPSGVDPCGENGEFHTFVFDGPIFNKRIKFDKGEVVIRENRFYFCDLLPKQL